MQLKYINNSYNSEKQQKMLQNYLSPHPHKRDLGSIQYLNSESNNESLLLSNNARDKKYPGQQNEQYLIKLKDLIEASHFQDKINQLSMIEQPTIIKDGIKQKQINYSQINRQQYKHQIQRLKKIIKHKNKTIGEITEEIKVLTQFINKILLKNKNKSSSIRQHKDSSEASCQEWKSSFKKEIYYLNKNNSDLFQQLKKCKGIWGVQNEEIKKIKQISTQMSKKITVLTLENDFLKKQNNILVKKTQQYLKEDKKQIQIVNKIREVLNQQINHKEMRSQYITTKKIYEQMTFSQKHAKEKQLRKALTSKMSEYPETISKSAQKMKKEENKYAKLRNLSQQLKRK